MSFSGLIPSLLSPRVTSDKGWGSLAEGIHSSLRTYFVFLNTGFGRVLRVLTPTVLEPCRVTAAFLFSLILLPLVWHAVPRIAERCLVNSFRPDLIFTSATPKTSSHRSCSFSTCLCMFSTLQTNSFEPLLLSALSPLLFEVCACPVLMIWWCGSQLRITSPR